LHITLKPRSFNLSLIRTQKGNIYDFAREIVMKIGFINSRYVSAIIFVLLALSAIPHASGTVINFSGQLDYVALDAGGAVYSNVPLGTDFFGAIDDVTFSGFISDGTTLTPFGCCIAAGGLSVENNKALDASEAMILNALGLTLSAGDEVDSINIEGDVLTASGGRIEIGLSYIFDASIFSDDSLSNYPFDPNDLDLALFFIAEFDTLGKEIYSAVGLINQFIDVPPGYWAEAAIYKIYNAGITKGCSQTPLMYCPENPVIRTQMAVFLERAIHGSSFTPPSAIGIFADVPVSYWAADWIEQFYYDGITSGCNTNPLRYCPYNNVTRAQMAIFLLRSKHGKNYTPPAATGIFSDVPVSYWASAWIEQLYKEGITTGCSTGPLRYCPENSVTRAQMAVFMMRTFGL
jgi:hypothetical protein